MILVILEESLRMTKLIRGVIMGGSSDDEMDVLEAAGLSYEELLLMDEDERRKVLEAAGLDPDDFEF